MVLKLPNWETLGIFKIFPKLPLAKLQPCLQHKHATSFIVIRVLARP
jgi:hypothetical protein